jgi:hypothetical protein
LARNAVVTHPAVPDEPLPVRLLERGEPAGDDERLPDPLPVLAVLAVLLVTEGWTALVDFVPVAEGVNAGMLAAARAVGTRAPTSGFAVPHAASAAIARTPAAIGSQRRGEPAAGEAWLPNRFLPLANLE